VLDADGHVVPEARIFRERGKTLIYGLPADIDVTPTNKLDGEVVYLGGNIGPFGHFLLEGMARSWILPEVDPSVPVVFQSPLKLEPGNWRTDLLLALGVTADRVLPLREPTRIRRLIVPEPLYELGLAAHERAADPHHAAADVILGRDGAGSSDQPVFLSRRLLPPARRLTVGEAQLEEILRANGFLVAYPETMSLADQIRLYNRHADIVATRGSAAHAAALFSRDRPRFHVLTGPGLNDRDYFLSMALSGAQATFVNSLEVGPTPMVQRLLHPSAATRYLTDRGLLKEPWTAKLGPSATLLRQEFEALSLYVRIRDAMKEQQNVPEDILTQAELLADDFWPLKLLLAWQHMSTDIERAEDLVCQFVSQVAVERDVGRLLKFRPDVERFAPQVASVCSLESATLLARTADKHFALDLSSLVPARERQPAPNAFR
jgi:hypothetical protein